jgi:hypothetical protein
MELGRVVGANLFPASLLKTIRASTRSQRTTRYTHVVTPLRRYVDGGPTSLAIRDSDEEEKEPVRCDACGEAIEGSPAGSGLFLWTRGDEIRYEEPPLCEKCAYAIAVGGTLQWEADNEE